MLSKIDLLFGVQKPNNYLRLLSLSPESQIQCISWICAHCPLSPCPPNSWFSFTSFLSRLTSESDRNVPLGGEIGVRHNGRRMGGKTNLRHVLIKWFLYSTPFVYWDPLLLHFPLLCLRPSFDFTIDFSIFCRVVSTHLTHRLVGRDSSSTVPDSGRLWHSVFATVPTYVRKS